MEGGNPRERGLLGPRGLGMPLAGNDKTSLQRKEDTMTHLDIIRAWKDEEYRLSLSEAERALLPANPAGLIELTDALGHVLKVAPAFHGRVKDL